ncbi:MAG: T9SS type A sorting domain-containing protein, partial [Urechidicola sp.]|nr:T9SS type A sorting domain-containing protein [Urechidicola sp.]
PTSTTTYTVTVSQNGCSSQDTVDVIVNPIPSANAGVDITINEGETTVLTASGGTSYLWSTGATTTSINVSPTTTSNYSVLVSQNGCSSNDDVLVTVIPTGGCNYTVINSEGFETGWGIWNDGGSDCMRNGPEEYATSGVLSMRLRDNSSSSIGTTDNLDLTGFEELTVDFGYYPLSMDNSNEDFWLQISTDGGNNFITIEEWNLNDEFINNQHYSDQVIISGPFSANTQLRFRCDASGNNDKVYLDDIVISGCSNGGAAKILPKRPNIQEPSVEDSYIPVDISTNLYPNPFIDQIIIEINGNYKNGKVTLFNSLGQRVYLENIENQQQVKIPTKNLQNGQYIIRLDLDEKVIYERVIKK